MFAWAVGVSLVLVLLLIWSALFRGSLLASLEAEQSGRAAGSPVPERTRKSEPGRVEAGCARPAETVHESEIMTEVDTTHAPSGLAAPAAKHAAGK